MTSTAALPDNIDDLKEIIEARDKILLAKEKALLEKEKALAKKTKKIELLEEYLRVLKAKQFGRSSERHISDAQVSLFNEAEQLDESSAEYEAVEDPSAADSSSSDPSPRTTTRKPGRCRFPDSLPRHKVYHELDADKKQCECGCELDAFDEVISEQLGIIPAALYVIQHCRKKYRCCQCKENPPVTAPLPPQPFPKSNASPELMAYIVISKFLDGLPFYRQEAIWKRINIELPRATQANWSIAGGNLAQPLVNLLREHQQQGRVMHIDETPVQVLKEPDKPPDGKKYFWVTAGGPDETPIILFHYHPSRGSDVAHALLDGCQGTVISDDWSVYSKVCETLHLTHIACNDHARRRFDEALKAEPKKKKTIGLSKAEMGLNYYKKLYAVERRIKTVSPEEKYHIRQQESVPIWKSFIEWIEKHIHRVTPESKLGKALHYTYKLKDKLSYYCEDGTLPISNQKAENAIRPFAIARKNFLFYDTPRGASASANLYSLIMTAKSYGLDPFYYLAYVFKQLPLATTVEQIEALLPWRVTDTALKSSFNRF